MKLTILKVLFGASLVWLGASPVHAAGNVEAGKKKFYTCDGCHAIAGYTSTYPTYHVPRLGGQHADYVIAALKAYGDDERKHGSMKGNVANLSEQDMEDIAAYVSKFRSMNATLPVTGDPQAGKAKAALCASCHGDDGNSDNPMFPRLAGQYESYLVRSLREYKSGTRNNPMMAGFAATLSEDDMLNLAAYYASQKKGLMLPMD